MISRFDRPGTLLVAVLVLSGGLVAGLFAAAATATDGASLDDDSSPIDGDEQDNESATAETDGTDDNLTETAEQSGDDLTNGTEQEEEGLSETAEQAGDSVTGTAADTYDASTETGDDDATETGDDARENTGATENQQGTTETAVGFKSTVEGPSDAVGDELDRGTDGLGGALDGVVDATLDDPNALLDDTATLVRETGAQIDPVDESTGSTDTGDDTGERSTGTDDVEGDDVTTRGDGGGERHHATATTSQSHPDADTSATADESTAGDEADETAGATETGDGNDGSTVPDGTASGVAVGTLLTGIALLGRHGSVAAWLSAGGGSSSVLSTLGSLIRAWGHRILLVIGYKRYSDDDPLEHEGRRRLYDAIRSSPGSYLAELSDESGLETETARYHLRILEFENLVSHETIRGRRRYFPVGTNWTAFEAALNDDATARLLRTLHREGPGSVSELADRLGRDPSTISHHLNRLAADDIIERERNGRAVTNRLTGRAMDAFDNQRTVDSRVPGRAD